MKNWRENGVYFTSGKKLQIGKTEREECNNKRPKMGMIFGEIQAAIFVFTEVRLDYLRERLLAYHRLGV